MSYDDRKRTAFDNLFYKLYQQSRIPAILGKGDGSTLFVYDDAGQQVYGKVWARLDGENAPRAVGIGNTPVSYGLRVFVYKTPEGQYQIDGKQSGAGNAYYSEGNGSSEYGYIGDVAPHAATHGRFASDPILVESFQFFPFMVRPTQTPSLNVRIEKSWYYVNGVRKCWRGGVFNLTSYRPTGTNEQKPIILALNGATNQPIVYEGGTITSTSVGVPFTPAHVDAITTGDLIIELAAIRLKTGQTQITLVDIFEDLRPFFTVGSIINNPATENYVVDDDGELVIDDEGYIVIDDG